MIFNINCGKFYIICFAQLGTKDAARKMLSAYSFFFITLYAKQPRTPMKAIQSHSKIATFLAIGCLCSAGTTYAIDFDFSGAFINDNDIVQLGFSVGSPSNVTIFSSSWLDFNNGMGFDPILAIWDSAGGLVQQQDDGGNVGSTLSNGVLYNHGVWDSYFTTLLPAGSFTATIGQYDNFAAGTNLADGFVHDANPNFAGGFVDNTGDQRTPNWEFHILNVDSATGGGGGTNVPDGGITGILLGLSCLGIGFARRQWARP